MGLDKVAHLLMYATFTFLCLWGYRKQFISNGIAYQHKALLLATAISIAYGGVTEMIQEYLVPSRTGDWVDFLADIAGTLVGATIFYLFYRKKK